MINFNNLCELLPLIKINKLSHNMGAEICNIDLTKLIDSSVLDMIKNIFFSNHLLVFRNQSLDAKKLVHFSRLLGDLDIHIKNEFHHNDFPEVLILSNKKKQDGSPVGFEDAGRYWHTDMSYTKTPPMASILLALEVPDYGGDTLFCNMEKAYSDLENKEKEFLLTLKAIHSYEASFLGLTSANKNRTALTNEQKKRLNKVIHPVIRTHKETNNRSIYVNPGFTEKIEGKSKNESKKILERIFDHCLDNKYIFKYKWKKNDLVIWDNSSVLHHATEYDMSQTRHMLRTTIRGSVPTLNK